MIVQAADIDETLIGRELVQLSHDGEAPDDRPLGDQVPDKGDITAIHRESVASEPRVQRSGNVAENVAVDVAEGVVVVAVGLTLHGIGPAGWIEVAE